GDIPLIAAHHLRRVRARYSLGETELAGDAVRWLCAQPWPGNVRELKACVERAALMSTHSLLTRADLEATTRTADIGAAARLDRDVLPLDEVEKLMIERAMTQSLGNVTRAAELLGLSR